MTEFWENQKRRERSVSFTKKKQLYIKFQKIWLNRLEENGLQANKQMDWQTGQKSLLPPDKFIHYKYIQVWRTQFCKNQKRRGHSLTFTKKSCTSNFRTFGSSESERMRYKEMNEQTNGTEIIAPSGKILGTNQINYSFTIKRLKSKKLQKCIFLWP